MNEKAKQLLHALGNEYGHLVAVKGEGDGSHVHLFFSGMGGRPIGLATTSQIQQTCIEHGFIPYAQDASSDNMTLFVVCKMGMDLRGVVNRVALDDDGLLVKLEGSDIHCIPMPPRGDPSRRRMLMLKAGDDVTIHLVDDGQDGLRAGTLSNHTLGEHLTRSNTP